MLVTLGLLTGAVVALLFAKVTRWYELLLLGGWGILFGAMLAGATGFDHLSIPALWEAIWS
jgi:hypothetical protein